MCLGFTAIFDVGFGGLIIWFVNVVPWFAYICALMEFGFVVALLLGCVFGWF